MSRKQKQFKNDIVWSSEPDKVEEMDAQESETLPPDQQQLGLRIEKSGRRGKTVTVIQHFIGQEADLKNLAKAIKQQMGVGGTTKHGTIEIQSDKRDQIEAILHGIGYRTKRTGG